RGRNLHGLLIRGHVRSAPLAPLERAAGLVDGDPVEPCEDHRATLEAADAAPRAQKRLLQDLLGFATVAEAAQRDGVQAVGMYVGKRFEGTDVAGLGPTDQLVLGHVRADGAPDRSAHGSSDSPASVSARAASARTRSKMPAGAGASGRSEEPPRRRRRARRARIPRLQSGQSLAWSSRRLRLRQLMSPST